MIAGININEKPERVFEHAEHAIEFAEIIGGGLSTGVTFQCPDSVIVIANRCAGDLRRLVKYDYRASGIVHAERSSDTPFPARCLRLTALARSKIS